MEISNALASLPVADMAAAGAWYERLLGPGSRPMPELIEWQFAGRGGLQVYAGPERAGGGSCTLVVADIGAVAAHLRASGLADLEPDRHEQVDTLMIKDPDGNSIAFAAPRTDALVH